MKSGAYSNLYFIGFSRRSHGQANPYFEFAFPARQQILALTQFLLKHIHQALRELSL